MSDWILHNARCQDILPGEYAAAVDLIVTSPPYDGLRSYGGYADAWDFEAIAPALTECLKPGGTMVWVVGDAIVDGSETGSSFRQALLFLDLGLRLHQTIIYERAMPRPVSVDRCLATIQYMFIFSAGKPRVGHIQFDRPNIEVGRVRPTQWQPGRDGDRKAQSYQGKPYAVEKFGKRTDI